VHQQTLFFSIAPIDLFSVGLQAQLLDSTCIAGELWKLRSHYKEYDFWTSEPKFTREIWFFFWYLPLAHSYG